MFGFLLALFSIHLFSTFVFYTLFSILFVFYTLVSYTFSFSFGFHKAVCFL